MASEGSREIEAARLRLAAAKSQVSTASKNMELVTKMMDNAKEMSKAADKEYAEAQIMLAAAEKRWEVIDVDVDDPESTDNSKGSNKRRKVSLSPQSNNNNSSTTNNPTSSTIASQLHRSFTNATAATNTITSNAIRSTSHNNFRVPGSTLNNVEIVVKCGIHQLNGTYTRVVGGDKVVSGSDVEYKRQGHWCGNIVDYVICLFLCDNTWKMGLSLRDGKKGIRSFYKSPNGANGMQQPPENGWKATLPEYESQKYLPLPTCLPPSRLFAGSSLPPPPPQTGTSMRGSQTGFKKCGKCGNPKKRHSYLIAEWDKVDDRLRVCQVWSQLHGL